MAFFICSQCGYGSASWLGRCPNCGEFNTLNEAPSYLKDDEQVKERAERLNINLDNFLFSDDLQVEGIIEGLEKLQDKVEVVVIDSIQTVYSKKVEGPPGSISQLKESAAKLINLAKNIKTALIIVGHITKGGEIA